MKIIDRIQSGLTLSFEVFPPKADKPLEPLHDTLEQLYSLNPDFISCTYGAMGSNKGRNLEVVRSIQQSGKCEALSHYTCVGNSREDVLSALSDYTEAGVENLLALRGDFPAGVAETKGDFAHANELIAFIRSQTSRFSLAAACYPEKHLLAESMDSDIDALLKKQDAGADFLMTQLCYSVENYLRFIDRARKRGVTLPIVAGVLPLLKKDGLVRMTLSNGCSIPAEVASLVGRYGAEEESFRAAGHEFTVSLVQRLIQEGANGIHLYTLNRFEDVADLVRDAGIREKSENSR
ncbi:MAG: 5,10-methylenetetrahydrofolate reductase [Firmicutes bacterium HGW-Firmicutes-9]|jgi:methylenetetrahydrofolate reductase (NADPH)|nr:MAG: 5,10-methylenetetrahydrofolate reductase [Firmicutes bacterium HGW-Firmicutes-9]